MDYRPAGRVVSVVRPSKLGTHWDQWSSETVLSRFSYFFSVERSEQKKYIDYTAGEDLGNIGR